MFKTTAKAKNIDEALKQAFDLAYRDIIEGANIASVWKKLDENPGLGLPKNSSQKALLARLNGTLSEKEGRPETINHQITLEKIEAPWKNFLQKRSLWSKNEGFPTLPDINAIQKTPEFKNYADLLKQNGINAEIVLAETSHTDNKPPEGKINIFLSIEHSTFG